jgi:hypothetical protein
MLRFLVLMLSLSTVSTMAFAEIVDNSPEGEIHKREAKAAHERALIKDRKDLIALLCKARVDQNVDVPTCKLRNDKYKYPHKFGRATIALHVCVNNKTPDTGCFKKALANFKKISRLLPEGQPKFFNVASATCSKVTDPLLESKCLWHAFYQVVNSSSIKTATFKFNGIIGRPGPGYADIQAAAK